MHKQGYPDFAQPHLGILPARRHIHAIWRVCHAAHRIEMPLLLEHVGLTLPLPHEQLAQLAAAQRDPFARHVEGDAVDTLVGYAAHRITRILKT